jgi:hypothetical protein
MLPLDLFRTIFFLILVINTLPGISQSDVPGPPPVDPAASLEPLDQNWSTSRGATSAWLKLDTFPTSSSIPNRLLIRVTSPSAFSRRIADMVFKNQFQVAFPIEPVTFEDGIIDWDVPIAKAENSFHLWLHSLNTVSYLSNAHEMSRNRRYLDRAWQIITDWVAYAKTGKNKYVWYDHSVSNRIGTFIYFYQRADGAGLLTDVHRHYLVNLIVEHADWLADPKNYAQYNHGVMMDKSFLLAVAFLNKSLPERYRGRMDLVMARILAAFERDYTERMVHIENSPAYHYYVTANFRHMVSLLTHMKLGVPASLRSALARTGIYTIHITKPDGYFPQLGDTSRMRSPNRSAMVSSVYPEAGVVVMAKRLAPVQHSTWLLFKSGYLTHIHKHADDLSFVLFAGGRDVFVDGGLYNYEMKDPINQYLRGALAHNGLVVDHTSYDLLTDTQLNGNSDETAALPLPAGLWASELSPEIDWARGFNHAYQGVALERTIVFVKPDIFLIYDVTQSSVEHDYSQMFRIDDSLQLTCLDDGGFSLRTNAPDWVISLVQLLPTKTSLHHGDQGAIKSYRAKTFNKVEPSRQIEFSQRAASAEYMTLIGIRKTSVDLQSWADESIKESADHYAVKYGEGAELIVERGVFHHEE